MATVKENGLTYRTLKRQINTDIEKNQLDYEYRLGQIDIFDGKRITNLEAEELRLAIEPYKPITNEANEGVVSE